jgi:hypothetical protein
MKTENGIKKSHQKAENKMSIQCYCEEQVCVCVCCVCKATAKQVGWTDCRGENEKVLNLYNEQDKLYCVDCVQLDHPLDEYEFKTCNQCKHWFDEGKECCKKCEFDFSVCNKDD